MSDFYNLVEDEGIRGVSFVMILHYWLLTLIIPLFPIPKKEQLDEDEIPF